MSWAGALAAIGGIAGIVTGAVYLLKRIDWQFGSTPAETDEKIEETIADDMHQAEDTGRPVI